MNDEKCHKVLLEILARIEAIDARIEKATPTITMTFDTSKSAALSRQSSAKEQETHIDALYEYGLTVRTRNCLVWSEITTVPQVQAALVKGDRFMMSIPNLGRRSLRDIRDALERYLLAKAIAE